MACLRLLQLIDYPLIFLLFSIRPESTIPICLDLGTNTQEYLDDPFYMGIREKRVSNQEMQEFMDEFMNEMSIAFPKMMIQFEVSDSFKHAASLIYSRASKDFSTDNAFKYLERFRYKYPVFNDDIQGTGAVVLSGFSNAAGLSSAASGRPLNSHRILFFGAGSAGVGVASQLMSFFTLLGMSEEDARRQIWLTDSQGLVYDTRGRLAEHKKCINLSRLNPGLSCPIYWLFFLGQTDFSRNDYQGPPMTNILDIIEYVKPTALLGLSTITVIILLLHVFRSIHLFPVGCFYSRRH